MTLYIIRSDKDGSKCYIWAHSETRARKIADAQIDRQGKGWGYSIYPLLSANAKEFVTDFSHEGFKNPQPFVE